MMLDADINGVKIRTYPEGVLISDGDAPPVEISEGALTAVIETLTLVKGYLGQARSAANWKDLHRRHGALLDEQSIGLQEPRSAAQEAPKNDQ